MYNTIFRRALILFLFINPAFAQKEVSNWYFGSNASLNFNYNPPQPGYNPNLITIEGCSSISDSDGALLFYTDGNKVYNRFHDLMMYGTNIGSDISCGGSSTQSVLIVKQPQSDHIYYIFSTDCAENNLAAGFRYSIVDMNLDGGNGAVILKNQLLLDKVVEKVAAVKTMTGEDRWIVTHEYGNNVFRAYRLTSSGLSMVPVTSMCGRVHNAPDGLNGECAARGHMKFSPQGDKLVLAFSSDCHAFVAHPELFSFNAGTGIISYDFSIAISPERNYYGASFSPDGNMVYFSGGWYNKFIHQFDLSSNDSVLVSNSFYPVYEDFASENLQEPGALQIGPDGKIYNANVSTHLNVISNPNQYGVACGFQAHAIPLMQCTSASYGLPNNDESLYLNPITDASTLLPQLNFSISDSCTNTPIQFINTSDPLFSGIDQWNWFFNDPASGSANTSALTNPVHTFSLPGTYNVTMYAYGADDCIIMSITKPVHIDCIGSDSLPSSPVTGMTTEAEIQLSVFPNPSAGTLHIESTLVIDEVHIFNNVGQLVHQETSNGNTIETIQFDLADGLYTLELISQTAKFHRRLIVTGH